MDRQKKTKIKDQINNTLKQIKDSGTYEDIISMGLVRDLSVDDHGKVKLVFQPSSSVCPMAFKLAGDIQKELNKIPGVTEVNISVCNFIHADQLERLLNKK